MYVLMESRLSHRVAVLAALIVAIAVDSSLAACINNCAICVKNGPNGCDACNVGYGLVKPALTCGACTTIRCNASFACNKYGGGNCDVCITGYTVDPTTKACVPCDPKCTGVCYIPYTCNNTCASGYAIDPTYKTCASCDTNCNSTHGSCTTPGTCKSGACNKGYVSLPDGTCGACAAHCTTKCTTEGAGYCDPCTPTPCRSCENGYTLKAITVGTATKHICVACASNCDPVNGCEKEGPGYCDPCTTTGCSSCTLGWGLKPTPGDVTKHACYPCSGTVTGPPLEIYCTAGCAKKGGGCCDASPCKSPRVWTNGTCPVCA